MATTSDQYGMYGSFPMRDRVWPGELVISGIEAPHEEWEVEPTLPSLGQDPRIPNSDLVVIARGRILGVVQYAYSSASGLAGFHKSRLTVCDGYNTNPIGFANNNIHKVYSNRLGAMPVVFKQKVISTPFVEAINCIYGDIKTGDKVMAYYGAYTSSTKNDNQVGRPVKWIERRLYINPALTRDADYNLGIMTPYGSYDPTTATSGLVLSGCSLLLSNAQARMYYGLRPNVYMAWSASGNILTASGQTLQWHNPWWTITTGSFCTRDGNVCTGGVAAVLYDYGASPKQIAGEVLGIEVVNTTNDHEFSGWLKWATTQFVDFPQPIITRPVPMTDASDENIVFTAVNGGSGNTDSWPIVPWRLITVKITGSYTEFNDDDGTVSTVTLTGALPRTDTYGGDYTTSPYYTINERSGRIDLSTSVTLDNVSWATISYSYEKSYMDGLLYDGGIPNLTDGKYTGVAGVPSNLEEASSVGELRVMIY